MAAAEKQYLRVLAIQPDSPPVAVVEAAARVARMRGQLWAASYLSLDASTAEPFRLDAKAAYEKCVDTGAKYEVQTRSSSACAAWLERHFPKQHPPLSELLPQPKWHETPRPPAAPRVLDDAGDEYVAALP